MAVDEPATHATFTLGPAGAITKFITHRVTDCFCFVPSGDQHAEQSAELDRMLDEDEPIVQQDEQDNDTSDIFAWFSMKSLRRGRMWMNASHQLRDRNMGWMSGIQGVKVKQKVEYKFQESRRCVKGQSRPDRGNAVWGWSTGVTVRVAKTVYSWPIIGIWRYDVEEKYKQDNQLRGDRKMEGPLTTDEELAHTQHDLSHDEWA
ncbi:hypothetical protein DFH07DRAFT_766255 [Mycena maculata]|uniref:Uncharacterized protein n=1 Tax=Mycena maculata TaxID=230809 RepID=A0AAD7NWF6_9AGAR|nr:hypothetical protein DFH07DRAFT_766255 [Mycena maculata]